MNYKHGLIKSTCHWIYFFNALYSFVIVPANVIQSPLIALQTNQSEYKIPKCLRKTSSEKLEYYIPGEDTKTIYFCPKSPDSFLLYPTKDEICENPPMPRLRRTTDEESKQTHCPNIKYIRTSYTFGYQVCIFTFYSYTLMYQFPKKNCAIGKVAYSNKFQKKGRNSQTDWKNIYTFCFDHVQKSIIHFSYQISSPTLLTNNLLEDDRQYLAQEYVSDDFNDKKLQQYIKEILTRYENYDSKIHHSRNHQAMIMTPYDMAFAIWKKPFMHLINYAIFHNTFVAMQWARIGIFIRELAIQGWGELHIKVGTVDHNFGNLYRIWWKLVITEDEANAIAIIVHDHALHEEPPKTEFECISECAWLGFQEMIMPLVSHMVFCCNPDVITSRVEGLKSLSYRPFDLSNRDGILRPLEVRCDPEWQTTNASTSGVNEDFVSRLNEAFISRLNKISTSGVNAPSISRLNEASTSGANEASTSGENEASTSTWF